MQGNEKLPVLIKRIFPTRKKTMIRIALLLLLAAGIWVATHINWQVLLHGPSEPEPVAPPVTLCDEFDFPIDSFSREVFIIRANQNLSEILQPRGISLQIIDKIAREYRYVFDVRDIRSNNEMHFYYTLDSLHHLEYMVYKKNAIDYVVYDFRDSVRVTMQHKEVVRERRYMEGEIKSNLWAAVTEQGVDVSMAYSIVQVFQWMIDEYSLQRGDQFEVIYEDQLVDGESIGVSKVFAARFNYSNRWFEAYEFLQNGKYSYFNEKGESLKREFLKAPIKENYRVSSKFSNSRMHPILRYRRPHHGVDYAAAAGTPVITIGDGKVIQRSYDKASGNMVKIKHNGSYTSGYMHLSKYGPGIVVGASVKQGQVIGYVGATGLATGPHLDFRIWKGGTAVDPLKIEASPTEPLEAKNRPQFDSIVREFRAEFEKFHQDFTTASDTP